MKLATLSNGTRDGQLVVVDRKLQKCRRVQDIARTLQHAIENWEVCAPALQKVYDELNESAAASAEEFDASLCLSPLPRAYQFVDGSAYLNHVELVRKARGATVPESFYHDPLMYQGCSDGFLTPAGEIRGAEQWGMDFEGEVAVVCTDVEMGAAPKECATAIRLIMLMNDVSLREVLKIEIRKELGFIHSKPPSAFAPVAVTPDELGAAWKDEKLHLPMRIRLNGNEFGKPNAGEDMNFSFADLLSHLARTRPVSAGTVVGGGTVSNKQGTLWGSSLKNGGVGYCCLAEVKMYETIEGSPKKTAYLKDGDVVEIFMEDEAGASIFGSIKNKVKAI